MEQYPEYVRHGAETAISLVSNWGLQVLGAVAVLIIGRWFAGRARKYMVRMLERAGVDAALHPFASGVSYYLVLAVTLIAVLNLFGVQTTSLIALLTAGSVAIGLAWQGTLSSFASGVMLLVFRPFRPGDYVEVGGIAGSVKEVGTFTTILATSDNVQITVPNAKIYGDTIKNYSANPTRRNDIVIGISYDDDIQVALNTIKSVIDADDRVLADPAPVIALGELADSSVNLVVRPWCKREDYFALRCDLLRTMKERLEAAGCSLPFPQTDVHVFEQARTG